MDGANVNDQALSVREAQTRILDGVLACDTETVAIEQALGRVSGGPICAKLTQPPFDASAMDGYAVRACDVATLPRKLKVIGQAAAGHQFAGSVGAGEAVRIFTGGVVPSGADAIVIQENTLRDGDVVVVLEGTLDRGHIRARGGDFKSGETLIDAGVRLGPSHLTLCAAMGHALVSVRRRPVVAILATGDELVPPGAEPAAGQIVASNAVGIAGLLWQAGGEPRLMGIARDTRDSLSEKILQAGDADVLVTIGGASVGDHDLVGPVLSEAGMALDFWKIAMRPGKPLLFGRLGSQRVVGVPGNPVSSLICTRVFVVPLVRALLGLAPAIEFERIYARVASPLSKNGPREHYMRAVLSRQGDSGESTVETIASQDSSLMVPLVRSNCLIVRESGAKAVSSGEFVPVLKLDF